MTSNILYVAIRLLAERLKLRSGPASCSCRGIIVRVLSIGSIDVDIKVVKH
jgi:hypothetical protein